MDHEKEGRVFGFWIHLEVKLIGFAGGLDEDDEGTEGSRVTPRYLA